MNKKLLTICLIVVLTLAVVCCAACDTNNHAEEMKVINSLMRKDYTTVELTVTTVTDDITLAAVYTFEQKNTITELTYEIDRLNSFNVNGNVVTVPSEYITRVTGKATFDGNKITSIDGDNVDVNVLLDVVDRNMMFRVSYFSDVTASKAAFSAKVTNPKGFMQNEEFDGTNMTVKVTYTETALTSLTIKYEAANGAKVTLDYDFAK